jgi:hypothetical protein
MSSWRTTLKQLTRLSASQKERKQAFREIRTGADRSAAIIAGAYLEDALTQAIISSFKNSQEKLIDKLYERGGSLNSLFSQVYLGWALGLYDGKFADQLNIIRRIRNAFAHAKLPIKFKTAEIAAACSQLQIPKFTEKRLSKKEYKGMKIHPRQHFIIGIYNLINVLQRIATRNLKRQLPKAKRETGKMHAQIRLSRKRTIIYRAEGKRLQAKGGYLKSLIDKAMSELSEEIKHKVREEWERRGLSEKMLRSSPNKS